MADIIETAAGPWGASAPSKNPISPITAAFIGANTGAHPDATGYIFDAGTQKWVPVTSPAVAPASTANPAARSGTEGAATPTATAPNPAATSGRDWQALFDWIAGGAGAKFGNEPDSASGAAPAVRPDTPADRGFESQSGMGAQPRADNWIRPRGYADGGRPAITRGPRLDEPMPLPRPTGTMLPGTTGRTNAAPREATRYAPPVDVVTEQLGDRGAAYRRSLDARATPSIYSNLRAETSAPALAPLRNAAGIYHGVQARADALGDLRGALPLPKPVPDATASIAKPIAFTKPWSEPYEGQPWPTNPMAPIAKPTPPYSPTATGPFPYLLDEINEFRPTPYMPTDQEKLASIYASMPNQHEYAHGGRVRERPQAPLTLSDNGDVGPAVYVKREEQHIYDVMPEHKPLTETSDGNMFMEGGERMFNMGGRAKKPGGRADGSSAPVKGYADGGQVYDPSWLANPLGSMGADGFDWATAASNPYLDVHQEGEGSSSTTPNPDYQRAQEIARKFLAKYPGYISVGGNEFSKPVDGYDLIDRGAIVYDREFGFITPETNLREKGGLTGWLNKNMVNLVAAGAGGLALAHSGALPGLGGAGADAGLGMGASEAGTGYVDTLGIGSGGGYMDAIGSAAEGASAGASLTGAVTPQVIAQAAQANPGWWNSIVEGAKSAGTSVIDFMRANPGLVKAGISLVAGLAGGSGAGDIARIPGGGINGPGSGSGTGGTGTGTGITTTAAAGADPRLTDKQYGILDLQDQIAREQMDHWRNTFLPVIKQYADEASKAGSESEQELARSRAIGNVATTFGSARGQAQRNMERYGLGSKSAANFADWALREGAARAGAANVAADAEKARGFEARARLAALAQGIPGMAGSIAGSAASNAAAMDAGSRGWATLDQNRQTGDADRALRRELGMGDLDLRRDLGNANIDQLNYNRDRQRYGDIGSFFGNIWDWVSKADGGRIIEGEAERVADGTAGGEVTGPGTETSDSVPARLSRGEMVINAESVKLIDEVAPGLLDRVNELGLQRRVMSEMGV